MRFLYEIDNIDVPKNVLIVEGSNIVQYMITRTFSLTNYNTKSVYNGVEALEEI